MSKQHSFKSLYYITHRDNVRSILERGILAHQVVERDHVAFTPIYDTAIVSNRQKRETPDGSSLWHYANLYFQPRNAMLYRVINETNKNDIVILGVSPEVLALKGAFVATGNAASQTSEIMPSKSGIKLVNQMWSIINSEWWRDEDGSKRKMMAECLIPERIKPEYIHSLFVPNHKAAEILQAALQTTIIPIIPEPAMFFQPIRQVRLGSRLALVEGDMFFSKPHTLTISVNTVGVMGKGLASRAKYQFPDMYVYYQDLCRQNRLQMGKPAIYKREASLDSEFAVDPLSLPNPNANKWFLLFATKRHWKEKSDFVGIERGLDWLVGNAEREGIQSLAVPALGCGLGGLPWQDVGPLMCRYLSQLPFDVAIYLPHGQPIPEDQLTTSFLLT